MFDFLEELILQAAGAWWMEWVVFTLCMVDGFFPVLPSESVLVSLASISDRSEAVHLGTLFIIGWTGAVVGDQIAYWLGRSIGITRFRWMRTRSVRRAVGGAQTALKHSAALVIITARHIPGGRVATNFVAGASRFHWGKFVLIDVISAAIWAGFSLFIGRVTSGWLSNTLLQIALALVVAALIGVVVDRIAKRIIAANLRRRLTQEAPAEGQAGLE